MQQNASPWVWRGSITFTPGNPPTSISSLGVCPTTVGAGSIVRNGAGDYSFTLGEAIDSAEFFMQAGLNGAVAASGLVSFGVAHTSDTEKRVTILQEGAAGAVSALTDVAQPVTLHFYKKTPRT